MAWSLSLFIFRCYYFVVFALSFVPALFCNGQLVINEIAAMFSLPCTTCSGYYIELYNLPNSGSTYNLQNYYYILRSTTKNTTITITTSTQQLSPGSVYIGSCKQEYFFNLNPNIGGNENVIVDLYSSANVLLQSVGPLVPSSQLSFSRNNIGNYIYTTPTPNTINFFFNTGIGTSSCSEEQVVLNEVATVTVPSTCSSNGGYFELYNRDTINSIYLDNWRFGASYDGGQSVIPFTPLATNTVISPNGYYLVCFNQYGINGIGTGATIVVFDSRFDCNAPIITLGPLPHPGSATATYSRNINDGTYAYTTPSPNAVNMFTSPAPNQLFINEVATTSANVCGSNGYIELYNAGSTSIDLIYWTLYVTGTPSSASKRYQSATIIPANGYLLECDFVLSLFTPIATIEIENNFYIIQDGVGMIPDLGSSSSYARRPDGSFTTTTTSTPNTFNVFTTSSPTKAPTMAPIIPIPVPIPVPVPFTMPIPVPVPVSIPTPLAPVKVPVPANSPTAPLPIAFTLPIPVPFTIPLPVPVKIPTIPAPVPVKLPILGNVPIPVSPVSPPAPATAPIPVPVTIPAPVSTPIRIPEPVPVPVPLKFPVPANAPLPVAAPMTVPVPLVAPVKATPPLPIQVPVPIPVIPPVPIPLKIPVPASLPVPTIVVAPIPTEIINEPCGIFGLRFFCPRPGKCGFWKRIFNIGNC